MYPTFKLFSDYGHHHGGPNLYKGFGLIRSEPAGQRYY